MGVATSEISVQALQFLPDATALRSAQPLRLYFVPLREMDGHLSNIIKSIEFMPL